MKSEENKGAPSIQRRTLVRFSIALGAMVLALMAGASLGALGEEPGQFGTPKGNEGTRIFKAAEHPYYSGEFHIKGERATLVGSMRDTPPWDHLDW
jgi:hypothetical protein